MKTNFRTLTKISLVLIYCVIVAGAVVRMTGSGMGCPDWPKCFGYFIPPTESSQLLFEANRSYEKGMMILLDEEAFLVAKSDFISGEKFNATDWEVYSKHDYTTYDPVHTWVEYINRLIGVLSGIPILIFTILAFWYRKQSIWIPLISVLTLFGMGFQAWLGKTVVDSNLAPYKITIHMVMALLIVAFILYLIFASKTTYKQQTYHKRFYNILLLALGLSLVQIILGTQVRQYIDEQTKLIGYQKSLWLASPDINFYIHRSTSILVLVLNGYLWHLNRSKALGFNKVKLVIYCVILEAATGILMYYYDFPFLSQPLHLVIASILFGIQCYILFECLHKKREKLQA
ncbi:MAG: COX15/CtaA family protein [Flavobacteriaceae bacterium]|jgi:heme a synthase|nr:heme A synthase [Formosa sp.]MDG2498974.1 COX15/CtaA family protein [Flavobacteriaceae bacterium]